MGLQDTIRKAASTAIRATGDLSKVSGVTYKQLTDAEYDASAGQTISNFNVYVNLTAIFVDFDRRSVDGENIQPTDQRMLLSRIDPITNADIGFIPDNTGDRVEIVNDLDRLEIWDVVNVKVDPAGALFDVQIRKRL